jgi:subtilisin family serine protease
MWDRMLHIRDAVRAGAWFALVLALSVAVCLSIAATGAFAADATGESAADDNGYVPNELIVVYAGGEGSSAGAIAGALQSLFGVSPDSVQLASHAAERAVDESAVDVAAIEDLGPIAGGDEGALLVTVADSESIDATIDELEQESAVAYAQPNYTYQLLENDSVYTVGTGGGETEYPSSADPATNDPMLDQQWYLEPWESSDATYGANVLAAWDMAKAEGSVTVAVLDSGCNSTHEDLFKNLDTLHAKDIYNNYDSGVIEDASGKSHGTHVAGIIGAVANNKKGIAGVSYNARVLPLKVFDDTATRCSTSNLIDAFNYLNSLIENGELDDLHVVNMSLGSYMPDIKNEVLHDAIVTMRNEHQVLTVCAGGNGDGTNPYTKQCLPGDFEEAVAVTALQRNGTNRRNSDYNLNKDISAPGDGILSTGRSGTDHYLEMGGTSMATPVVSGIAALLWAYKPDLTVDQVVEAITTTAQPLSSEGANYHMPGVDTGSPGCIDAAAAIAFVEDQFTPLSEATIAPIAPVTYTGQAHEPEPVVTLGAKTLVAGTDYEVSYANNTDAGTATVTITGIGAYVGKVTVTFTIEPASIEDAEVAPIEPLIYTGTEQTPVPVLTFGNTITLAQDTDFVLGESIDNRDVGEGAVTITGVGNFTGNTTVTFRIEPAPATVAVNDAEKIYGEDDPAFTASVSGLVGTDDESAIAYAFTREPGEDVGSYAINATVTDPGNYDVICVPGTLVIAIAYLDDAEVVVASGSVYDGGIHEPSVTVMMGDDTLTAGTDFMVAYANNTNAGIATATVTGINNYARSSTATFQIAPAPIASATITGIAARGYTGKARTQSPAVSYPLRTGTAALAAGTDYALSYRNNVNPGTATVTITGVGNFTGSTSRTFAINQIWYRVWGATAADTMRAVAAERGTTATHAIITSETSYKDALAASSLAGRYGGIVLTTKKGSLTPQTRAALQASGVKTVFIVGSTANVSNATQDAIRKVPGVKNVWRVNGTTPSQRAVAIAKKTDKSSDTVIIATQNDYRDALAIAPYAYATKSPILYAETSKKLSAETTAYLKSAGYTKAIVVGGPLALPASVDMQLRVAGIRQANITRLAGANAYETSVQIADWATGALQKRSYGTYKGAALAYVRFQPSVKLGANKLAVATGQDWRDAVCGAALCGRNRAVMLLADSKTAKSNHTRTASWCTAHKAQIKKAYVLGGTSAVSAKVWDALLAATE